ncbi:MAG: hypothetical protein HQK53_07875 [Oligoflexia bacterium]|nr:hypothetical protein [Oligoflexia bacterium]
MVNQVVTSTAAKEAAISRNVKILLLAAGIQCFFAVTVFASEQAVVRKDVVALKDKLAKIVPAAGVRVIPVQLLREEGAFACYSSTIQVIASGEGLLHTKYPYSNERPLAVAESILSNRETYALSVSQRDLVLGLTGFNVGDQVALMTNMHKTGPYQVKGAFTNGWVELAPVPEIAASNTQVPVYTIAISSSKIESW